MRETESLRKNFESILGEVKLGMIDVPEALQRQDMLVEEWLGEEDTFTQPFPKLWNEATKKCYIHFRNGMRRSMRARYKGTL